jgi:hypothetical protein
MGSVITGETVALSGISHPLLIARQRLAAMSALLLKADIQLPDLTCRLCANNGQADIRVVKIVVVNLAGRRLHPPRASRSAVPCC